MTESLLLQKQSYILQTLFSCSEYIWTSSLWGWRSRGTGCPGRLWSLLLCRYSRPL